MDEYRILSQASHKGANAHNHGADQRAEFISVYLIYPSFYASSARLVVTRCLLTAMSAG